MNTTDELNISSGRLQHRCREGDRPGEGGRPILQAIHNAEPLIVKDDHVGRIKL